ncbi:chemotaxis protein CheA [Anaeromyxobacter paludicola]|uniref:Chemotaxis protein CheA n=1 Tax=Anaeromyxobacter paludicola TaxID=2918171 RepID=A0ABN6N7G4_9BACT|nr:chemotaxis protein CheA [Anaeromyxobacter paludicola]BDG09110.1 hypothetical protein AMPC_22230 [Anaeromyxobacter paludicola]
MEEEEQIDWRVLVDTFLEESAEILAGMETTLVGLEAAPGDEELVHALFRAAHTIKGSASLVSFEQARAVAHQVESVLQRVRARTLAASPEVISLLLASVDVLKAAVRRDQQGEQGPFDAARRLEARIAEALAGAPPPAQAAPPGAAPPGAAPPDFAPEAAGPAPAAAPAPEAPRAQTLRVDVAKLDRLLDLAGEISVSRGRFASLLEAVPPASPEELIEAYHETDRLYLDLQEHIISARMVPVGPAFQQQRRTVRDLARAEGKQVELVLEGEETEVDTAVVEHIRDPLMHMVRNALDHGIERPEARRERGKAPCGRLTLRAFHEASSIVVEVADDGGGLPRRKIAQRAHQLGLAPDPESVTEADVRRLIFEPGFSTTAEATEVSGRGVGMDVVRRNVESLRGAVDVRSVEGEGTTFSLRFPLTLAVIRGFRMAVGPSTYIAPLDAVLECVDLPAGQDPRARTGVLELRGKPLPYLRLRTLFGLGGAPAERESVLVVRHGASRAGLAVDALLGESQTVIKPLGAIFRGLPGICGSAILGNGRVALILDVPALLRAALGRGDEGFGTDNGSRT